MTFIAFSIFWIGTNSYRPWKFRPPAKILGQGKPLKESCAPSVPPRIGFTFGFISFSIRQSGIGVRAIRMTARIAPTNAAAPMTANTFLPSFFFAALQIRAAQAMQTAAATSAMPSVSHSQDSSYRIFTRSSSPVR